LGNADLFTTPSQNRIFEACGTPSSHEIVMKVTFGGVRASETATGHHSKAVDFEGVMRKKRLEIKWSERRDSNHAAVFSYVLKLLWVTALQIS
jgi:hypothetical protein